MSEATHRGMRLWDNHPPFRWQWPDQTAQDAQTVSADDLYCFGLREDTFAIYMLTDPTPTWEPVGISPGTITIENVSVAVSDEISFDIVADVPNYPYAVRVWIASSADGGSFSPEPDVAPQNILPILNHSHNRDLLVGIDDSSPHTFAYNVFGVPDTIYICWVNPDGTYSVDGPHTVTLT